MRTVESLSDLESMFELSHTKPVLLFKHSTRCSLSSQAYVAYKSYLKTANTEGVEYTYLDLLVHRDVSDAIAENTGIVHKSPQAILLVDGKPVWDASHFDINEDNLAKAAASVE